VNGGKTQNGDDGTRCDIRPSPEQTGYLEQLVRLGLYGKNRTDVARYLVIQGLERLAREGILKLDSRQLSPSPTED
jgi:hypothetical protein